jgi:hypothetical protein
VDARVRRARGKRAAAGAGDGAGGGWDWGAIYAAIATATGWRFADIDELSLDDLADLWLYWQDYPPPHVTLMAALGVHKASARRASAGARSLSDDGQGGGSQSAMEAVAAVLGPPVGKFRPPCRMI